MEYNDNQKLGLFSGLFRSEVRKTLLLLFFLNPETEYYIRGLEKTLTVSAGNIRRELLKLEKDNIIISRQMGNLKLFKINKDNSLYTELRKIVLYSVGVQKLLEPVFTDSNFTLVFIYGSYVKDEMDFSSDIDLFVVTDKELDTGRYEKLNNKIGALEHKIGREINLDFHSKSEYEKLKNEKNSYVVDVLKGKKIFIKGGESEL